MFMRRNFMILLYAVSIGGLLWGCAALPTAPRFPWGQPVEFEGISFDFNSARTASSFTNWLNHRVAAGELVIVEVTMMNKTGSPLPHHFQPVFRLLDSTGAIYEPHPANTLMINMNKPGRVSSFQNMNPNTNLKRELVFEVPRKNYDLQVIVPSRARVGFAGSVTSAGPYFIYDISSQLGSNEPQVAQNSSGRFNPSDIDDLKPGVSTIADAKKLLGEPRSEHRFGKTILLQWFFGADALVGATNANFSIIFAEDGKMIRLQRKSVIK